ncbi:hypothetical protein [Salinibaculum salinum]|uniref:hypothetical protein n=1 Tax=Salinibaculum salinum TaxID=3131996 RepID=UPI0030EF843C
MTGETHSAGLVETVRQRMRFYDVALLASVPLVLLSVFVSPAAVRRSLVFEYTDPSFSAAFASAFVHFDRLHLFVNLATYTVVVSVVFALAVASGHRRQFYVVFLNFVLVLPALLSYLNLSVVRSSVGFGFSGVVMAFAGYLPLSLAEYAERRFDIGPRAAVAPVLFFLTLGIIAVLSVQSVVAENATVFLGTSGLVAATLLSALLYAVSAFNQGPGLLEKIRAAATDSGYFELGVVALVLVFGLPFVAFPTDPRLTDSSVNLYVHLLGYSLGFLVPFVAAELEVQVTD